MNELRVGLREGIVTQADSLHAGRPQVLNEDVGGAKQIKHCPGPFWARHIQRQATLVSVDGEKLNWEGSIGVARRWLDPNDIGAVFGQH